MLTMANEEVKKPQVTAAPAPKHGQQQKKKKKNAPDRPQPAWLFPPDDQNPVLNPKPKTEEQKKKEYEDRMGAIKFLKHKAVSAPMKTAPPTQLLTLIGAFLASYGFNSTGRIYTLERNARKKLDGWNDEIGAKIKKGTPDLVKIYKDWSKDYYAESSSEGENGDEKTKVAKATRKAQKLEERTANAAEDTSSSGSEETSSEEKDHSSKSKTGAKLKSAKKAGAAGSTSGSSSTSTSDSDADDEKDVAGKASTVKPTVAGLVNKLKRKAAPGASFSSESTSDSDFDSDSSSSNRPAKKKQKKSETTKKSQKKITKSDGAKGKAEAPKKAVTTQDVIEPPAEAEAKHLKAESKSKSLKAEAKALKVEGKQEKEASKNAAAKATKPSDSSSESSSNDSSSSSDSVPSEPVAPKTTKQSLNAPKPSVLVSQPLANGRKESTDSSTTLNPNSPKKSIATKAASSSSSSTTSTSSDSDSSPAGPSTTATKRKRSASPQAAIAPNTPVAKPPKKQNTPFSRIPPDTKVDPKLASNAYVPNDYAEKAHHDLIVTKGKGFTKEKNKKKRGA